MSQLQTDTYTIAWFKLAEFVARKEKERALGIYRLLTHSLQDQAVAYQLEGDLLFSFGDAKALDSYAKAAELYEQQGKYIQAIALYEHFITLKPLEIAYGQKLFSLSCLLNQENKKNRALYVWAQALAHAIIQDNAQTYVFEELEPSCQLQLYDYIVMQLAEKQFVHVYKYIDMTLMHIKNTDETNLNRFVARLEAISAHLAQYAQEYQNNNF